MSYLKSHKFSQAVLLNEVYLSLQLYVPIFAFSAVLWHCSRVILVASCDVVLFSILFCSWRYQMFRQYQAHRKRVCVCVWGGGGGGGSRGFAQPPPFGSLKKSLLQRLASQTLPFISSPLAIEESPSSEVVLLLQCTVKGTKRSALRHCTLSYHVIVATSQYYYVYV